MCLGIFLWDYNRVKVYYYKDYSEYNGVPQGIGRLSSNVMKHRESSYKFEYRRHRLIRLSLVNSAGKVINHSDTEHMNSRSSEVHYFIQLMERLIIRRFMILMGEYYARWITMRI